jgi:hypothetical protein
MQEEFLYTTKLWFAVHENSLIVDRETGRRCKLHEFEETLGDFDGFLLGLNLKQRETDLVALADSALQI